MMQVKASRDRVVTYAIHLVWVACFVTAHTDGLAQVNIDCRRWPLKKAVDTIRVQTGRDIFYAEAGLLERAHPVSLHLHNASVEDALQACLKDQDLNSRQEGRTFFIERKPTSGSRLAKTSPSYARVHSVAVLRIGVFNQKNEPLEGASILDKATGYQYKTDKDGVFRMPDPQPGNILVITFAGLEPAEHRVDDRDSLDIRLQTHVATLDETMVIPYGESGRERSTGNIFTITAKDIHNQPVANPLAALYGRVPGLMVTQSSGVPGAEFSVVIRGQSSLASGTTPLFIIDRIPYYNQSLSNIISGSAAGSLSPFSIINQADVESIQVLKDADATAIYGSRGANGVILITTRKRKAKDGRLNIQLLTGVSHATRRPPLLNTPQFVRMRTEALQHDHLEPDIVNSPDLVLWDTTRTTDWGQVMIGDPAHITSIQGWVSGGNASTNYTAGLSWLRETNVYPGHPAHSLATANANFHHLSRDNRLSLQLTGLLGADQNHQFITDLTRLQFFSPNGPQTLTDSNGNLLFWDNGVYFNNPKASTRQSYKAVTYNLLGNGLVSYRLFRPLTLRTGFGSNIVHTSEESQVPIRSQDASSDPTGSSYSAGITYHCWIIEQELDYQEQWGMWKLNMLAGGTLQGQRSTVSRLSATGFTSDALLSQPAAAALVTADKELADYHYGAGYARINVNWNNAYILNLTGRRDGSSRFGPGKQFGNFGAIGLAWIFRKGDSSRTDWPFLSFGKVRGSVGVAGNDQIGDYQYLSTWSNTTTVPYQHLTGFYPTRPANGNLRWETIKKMEVAVDLAFLQDRISFTGVYYRHRSYDQLVYYSLPLQTGFTTELRNSPAVVMNAGWEFNLRMVNIHTSQVQWTTTLNGSIPTNRLVAFPGLANSSYGSYLVVGQPIEVVKAYRFLGVDPATGIFRFTDVNKDGKMTDSDRVVVGSFGLRWFGGITNSLRAKSWQLDIHIEFRAQKSRDYITALYNSNPPGMQGPGQYSGTVRAIEDRWEKAGDHSRYQQVTTLSSSPAGQAILNYTNSSAALTDASFARIKTIAISYQLSDSLVKRLGLGDARFFAEAQNILTLSRYRGVDPEISSAVIMPPLATIAVGFQCTIK